MKNEWERIGEKIDDFRKEVGQMWEITENLMPFLSDGSKKLFEIIDGNMVVRLDVDVDLTAQYIGMYVDVPYFADNEEQKKAVPDSAYEKMAKAFNDYVEKGYMEYGLMLPPMAFRIGNTPNPTSSLGDLKQKILFKIYAYSRHTLEYLISQTIK